MHASTIDSATFAKSCDGRNADRQTRLAEAHSWIKSGELREDITDTRIR